MLGPILTLAGWYFLPNLATTYIQIALYAIFTRAGDPKPTPGTPRYTRDKRLIHISVILLYLTYTVYEADYTLQQQSDFYRLLSVPLDADERTIQSRFRRLTVQFHPDKHPNAPPQQKAVLEAAYMQLTVAKDTLIDPVKRFAYDRLGPEALEWKGLKLVRDYIMLALQRVAGYYVGSGAFLVVLGVLGYVKGGTFWRWMVLGTMFVIELWVMTRPYFPPVLTKVINPVLVTTGIRAPYLPFQFVMLLRKIAITSFIAMAQLGPLLRSPAEAQRGLAGDGKTISDQQLNQIDMLAKTAHQEIARLMGLELAPFVSDRRSVTELRQTVKEWLINNTIRNEPELNAAVGKALERRRQEHSQQTLGS